jgi:hypothetical protein
MARMVRKRKGAEGVACRQMGEPQKSTDHGNVTCFNASLSPSVTQQLHLNIIDYTTVMLIGIL